MRPDYRADDAADARADGGAGPRAYAWNNRASEGAGTGADCRSGGRRCHCVIGCGISGATS
jgi:hypothetical protein